MSDLYQNPLPHCSKDNPPPTSRPRQLEAFKSICSELSSLVGTIDRDFSEAAEMKETLKSQLNELEVAVVKRRRIYESCLTIGDEFKKIDERIDKQGERLQSLIDCEKSVDARQGFIDERKKIFDY